MYLYDMTHRSDRTENPIMMYIKKRIRLKRNHAMMKITALHISNRTSQRGSLRKHEKKWLIMQCANQANNMRCDNRSHGCNLD